MANDLVWIVLCTFTLSFLCILTGLYVVLSRKARIFTCPVCDQKVSREQITLTGISCPECLWRLIPPSLAEETSGVIHQHAFDGTETCAVCHESLNDLENILLWDNRLYCKPCVTHQSPALWDYAIENETINEEAPHSLKSIFVRMFLLFDLSMLAIFGSMAFYAGFEKGGIWDGLTFLFWCQMFLLPLLLVFVAAAVGGFMLHRPTVSICDGRLALREGSSKSLTKPLDEFEWFLGDASKTVVGSTPMPGGPAVLIVLPREKATPERYVAVGFTDQSREIWTAFLSLTNMERRSDWEKKTPRWFGVLNVLFVVLLIPGGFAFCFGTGILFSKLLGGLLGNPDLALLLGSQLFVPGTIFFFVYAIVLWPNGGLSRGRTKNTPEERGKVVRKTFWPLFLTSVFIVGLIALCYEQATLVDRTLMVAVAIPCWFFVCRDLAKRIADRT